MIRAVLLFAAFVSSIANESQASAGDIGFPEGMQLIIDHPPTQAGGPASDTEFMTATGQPFWQQSADNFQLAEPAIINEIRWHGFYHLDNPPAIETFRIRFYDARPGDGLPGAHFFEEFFLSPTRIATGLLIGVGVLPHEYLYTVELMNPIQLDASVPYWLEITQMGDIQTHFRFEYATPTGLSYAFINPNVTDWEISTALSDLAFELWSIPEPSTCVLLLGGLYLARRRVARYPIRRLCVISTIVVF